MRLAFVSMVSPASRVARAGKFIAGVGESEAGGGRSGGAHARLDQLEIGSHGSPLLNVEMAGSQENAYVRVIGDSAECMVWAVRGIEATKGHVSMHVISFESFVHRPRARPGRSSPFSLCVLFILVCTVHLLPRDRVREYE